jgi:hypothetical protein
MQEKKTKPAIPVKKGKGISPINIHLDPVGDIVGELYEISNPRQRFEIQYTEIDIRSTRGVCPNTGQYTDLSFSAEKPRIQACRVGCSCHACLYNNCIGHIEP